MKVSLTDSQNNNLGILSNWEDADAALRRIFSLQKYSDVYYHLEVEELSAKGSIDLEPASFHEGWKNNIFTCHLRTYWTNVSKLENHFLLTQEDIEFAKELIKHIPPMPTIYSLKGRRISYMDYIKSADSAIENFRAARTVKVLKGKIFIAYESLAYFKEILRKSTTFITRTTL